MQENHSYDHIVITGIGLVSPYGIGVDLFHTELAQGHSAIRPVERCRAPAAASPLGAEVKGFRLSNEDGRIERLPLISQYAIVAAEEALKMSEIAQQAEFSVRTGVYYGSCYGPGEASVGFNLDLIEKGPACVKPLLFQETVFNAPSALISIRNHLKGPHMALANGFTSGAQAMEMAYHALRQGEIDFALVGASDVISDMQLDAFWRLGYLASKENVVNENEHQSNRMVLGEGAGFIVMERSQTAVARGAKILAQISGISSSHDAYAPFGNDPRGRVLVQSCADALAMADVAPHAIDLVLTTANGTFPIDRAEKMALAQIFGDGREPVRTKNLKALVGETAAVAIFIEIAAALWEFDEESSGVNGSDYVLCNSSHYSGTNVTAVLKNPRSQGKTP